MSTFLQDWMIRRAMSAPVGGGGGGGMQRILYLESSFTQYIDTGVHFMAGDEFYYDFAIVATENNNECKGYGAGVDLDHNICGGGRNQHWYSPPPVSMYASLGDAAYSPRVYPSGNNNILGVRLVENWKHTYISNKGTIDSTLTNTATQEVSTLSLARAGLNQNFDSGNNVFLFKDNSVQYASPSSNRIYECWLKREDGTFAFKMYPVRVGSIGYMYDEVSSQLFGNLGTGDFILGPDI